MKKLLNLFLAIGISSFSFCQTTVIPDPNFEQALIDLGYDTAPLDGSVPTANINAVTLLNVQAKNISDLTGIEDFDALEHLNCAGNQLTSLNISNNSVLTYLGCYGNQLTSLDVSNNPALVFLSCGGNQLTSLNLNNNAALNELYCYGNQLTSLDLSNNPSLAWIVCYTNQLTSLDVRNGNNTNILAFDNFNSLNNPNLTCIYVDDIEYSSQNWLNVDQSSNFVENEAECEALAAEDNLLDIALILYPSPTDSYLFVRGAASQFSATVYNMLGKPVLFTNNTDKIDVSGLADGVYVIRISDGVNETQRKFVKN